MSKFTIGFPVRPCSLGTSLFPKSAFDFWIAHIRPKFVGILKTQAALELGYHSFQCRAETKHLFPENFKWTKLPLNETQVITQSSLTLQWGYDFGKDANLTSIEFRRIREDAGSSDIGSIDQEGVVNVQGVYRGHVTLTFSNQSAILTINAVQTTDDAEYCCKLRTTKGNAEACARVEVLGKYILMIGTPSLSWFWYWASRFPD